jgi:squalene-hopene/tetraprenyl-beta-curcumene cyclase
VAVAGWGVGRAGGGGVRIGGGQTHSVEASAMSTASRIRLEVNGAEPYEPGERLGSRRGDTVAPETSVRSGVVAKPSKELVVRIPPHRAPEALVSQLLDTSVARAVDHCLETQRPDGAWEAVPEPRILENALVAHALSLTPGDRDADVVADTRDWLEHAPGQEHSPVARAVEEAVCAIALRIPGYVLDLSSPDFSGPVNRSRAKLVHVLAVGAGVPVYGASGEQELRLRLAEQYQRADASLAKQWSKVELAALHVLLEARAGCPDGAQPALDFLCAAQDADGGYSANPVSTAVAYLALVQTIPASQTCARCRSYLLSNRKPDGTWRFCTSDVWDTVLTMRSFRGYPGFDECARPRAAGFLRLTQNSDGGWSFRSSVESDNDTTAAAVLALQGDPESTFAQLRALQLIARLQQDDGLWRTWYSKEDPPTEDVNAHVVSALNATVCSQAACTRAARSWLGEQYRTNGHWTPSWYCGTPYAVCEVSEALGADDPCVREALATLESGQNSDGGWGHSVGGPSLPSATGLVVAALVRQGRTLASKSVRKGVEYLATTQNADGTWPGVPEMYGPRPLLSHYQTHTQGFAGGGAIASWNRAVNLR